MARSSAVFFAFLALGIGIAVYQTDRVGPLLEQYAPTVKQALDSHAPALQAAMSDVSAHVRLVVEQARTRLEGLADQLIQEHGSSGNGNGSDAPTAACGIAGKVSGCDCGFDSTETLIQHELKPLLSQLVTLPFFKYFKVNLYCDCEFWPDAGMCFSPDCCVEACDDSEVPEPWRKEAQVAQHAAAATGDKDCSDPISPVDRSVDPASAAKLDEVRDWSGLNNPWVPDDDQGVDYIYVNLQLNPERYTGYKGEDARRIWASIYAQSAFDDVHGHDQRVAPEILEKQVLYRLISGMHSSITTSIIQNFYNETSGEWGPNLPFFKARFVGNKARPYVENLYFTFLFLLRAVIKAGPVLQQFDYNTGFPQEDALTRSLMLQLERSHALHGSCKAPFDEGLLWQAREPAERKLLEEQLQVAFHNITKLMDCVGCEKCKMWGKVQMLGIATSLKILFSSAPGSDAPLQLHRNEVIALVNLLAKVADSVETVRSLSLIVAQERSRAQT